MTTIMGQMFLEPAVVAQALAVSTGLAEYPNGESLHAALESTFLFQQAPVRGTLFDIRMGRQFRGVPNLARALATVKNQAPARYEKDAGPVVSDLIRDDRTTRTEGIVFREVAQRQIGVADTLLWDLADMHQVFLLMNEEDQLIALVRAPQAEKGAALYIGKQDGDPLTYISHQQLPLEHGPLDLVVDGEMVLHRRNNGGNVSVQRLVGIESAPALTLKDNDRFLIGGGFYLQLITLHDAAEEIPAEETRIGAAVIDDSPPPAPTLKPTAPIRVTTEAPITGIRLYSLHRDDFRFSISLAPGAKVNIGRDANADSILIKNQSVSRLHAHLRRTGDQIFIQDLGSSNGTFVNGIRIDEAHVLHPGDRIRLGHDVELTFDYSQEALPLSPPPPPPPRRSLRESYSGSSWKNKGKYYDGD